MAWFDRDDRPMGGERKAGGVRAGRRRRLAGSGHPEGARGSGEAEPGRSGRPEANKFNTVRKYQNWVGRARWCLVGREARGGEGREARRGEGGEGRGGRRGEGWRSGVPGGPECRGRRGTAGEGGGVSGERGVGRVECRGRAGVVARGAVWRVGGDRDRRSVGGPSRQSDRGGAGVGGAGEAECRARRSVGRARVSGPGDRSSRRSTRRGDRPVAGIGPSRRAGSRPRGGGPVVASRASHSFNCVTASSADLRRAAMVSSAAVSEFASSVRRFSWAFICST